ncbi:MAG: hypothetical protein U0V74_14040 [Chitinophagales bacterium]
MKIKCVFTLLAIAYTCAVTAQTDSTIFNVVKKVETTDYVFSVPERWLKTSTIESTGAERRFEFTDVGLPHVINSNPLTATFTMRKFECDTVTAAIDFVLNEFVSLPDRITAAGYNYTKDSLQIASGEQATLISTHYYRRSKVFNYTRFDLVVYSHKRKAAYMLTAIYQYKDPTYACETDLKMKAYMLRVFKTLVLR